MSACVAGRPRSLVTSLRWPIHQQRTWFGSRRHYFFCAWPCRFGPSAIYPNSCPQTITRPPEKSCPQTSIRAGVFGVPDNPASRRRLTRRRCCPHRRQPLPFILNMPHLVSSATPHRLPMPNNCPLRDRTRTAETTKLANLPGHWATSLASPADLFFKRAKYSAHTAIFRRFTSSKANPPTASKPSDAGSGTGPVSVNPLNAPVMY